MKSSEFGVWKTIVEYRQNSVFIRFFTFIVIILATVLISVSVSIFYSYNQSLESEMIMMNDQSIDRMKDVFDFILTGSDDLSLSISENIAVKDLLKKTEDGQWNSSTISAINRTIKALSIYSVDYIDRTGVYVYANNMLITSEGLVDVDYNASEDSWNNYIDRDMSPWGSFVYTEEAGSSRFMDYYESIEANVTTTDNLMMLRALTLNGKQKGMVFIRIKLDQIESFYGYDNEQALDTLVILDRDRVIKYSNDTTLIGRHIKASDKFSLVDLEQATDYYRSGGQRYLISTREARYNGYTYMLARSIQSDEANRRMAGVVLVIVLVSIAASLFLSTIISYYMYRPFRYIIKSINNLGEASQVEPVSELGELKYIVSRFTKNYKNQLALSNQLDESLDKLKMAQTLALQSQINPHFLYNTLNDINIMALQLSGQENDVSRSIRSLSEMLRISFQSKDLLISVSMELEHVRSYLEIESMRYPDKFSVVWDIDEEIMDCVIVKTVLQPIVENAIHHGLKTKRDGGIITIVGERYDDQIRFLIIDNGKGMAPEKVKSLTKSLSSPNLKIGSHIGIANVSKKIGIIFGSDYGVTIESQPGSGTEIQVLIPAIRNE